MTEPSAVLAALNSLKAANDIVKIVRSAGAGLERAELQLRIADIAEALADARMKVLDLREEIEALKKELAELRSGGPDREGLEVRDQVYYFERGGARTGPFCPRCFEVDGVTVPIAELPVGFRDLGRFRCNNCRGMY